MALVVQNPPASAGDARDCRLDPWVGKIPWRRAWLPTPVFLPGESHGQSSLVVRGVTVSDTTRVTQLAHTSLQDALAPSGFHGSRHHPVAPLRLSQSHAFTPIPPHPAWPGCPLWLPPGPPSGVSLIPPASSSLSPRPGPLEGWPSIPPSQDVAGSL